VMLQRPRWLPELNAIDREQRTTIHPPRQSLISV
jgi:hypothetical protein